MSAQWSRAELSSARSSTSAASLNNLAVLLEHQQKFDQAIPLIERALAIQEQVLGAQHPDTVQTRASLANMCAAAQGSKDAAG